MRQGLSLPTRKLTLDFLNHGFGIEGIFPKDNITDPKVATNGCFVLDLHNVAEVGS